VTILYNDQQYVEDSTREQRLSSGSFWCLFACLLVATIFALAPYAYCQSSPSYQIIISGVEEELKDNILALLSLKKYQTNTNLNPHLLAKYKDKAQGEIKKALEPFGYYAPTISLTETRRNAQDVITISIEKGPPTIVAQTRIECIGQGCDSPWVAKLRISFPLQSGATLDHRKYTQGKQQLITTALNKGYQNARLSRNIVEVSARNNTAVIGLTLELGDRYFFGPITYQCDFINHSLLRKITAQKEGDPLSPRAITRIRQLLLGTGYFATADIQYNLKTANAGRVPVTIQLTPGVVNRYGVGIGVGTDTGFRGRFDWYNQRVNRFGHQFDLQLQPSERKSRFGGVYTIPISDPKKEKLSLLGKWENENFDNTESKSWTSSVSYDELKKNGEYSLYLKFLDEDYTAGLDSGHATILAPGVGITWRWTDDRIKASQGLSVTGALTGGNNNLLSDTTFIQGSILVKAIYAFLPSWRFIGKSNIGATAADEFLELPPSLRFYAGGDQSVRGYGYKRIGPKDAAGNVIGGRYLFTYSLELEKEIFDNWSTSVFFDSGTATNSWDELTMQNGAGVGIRWNAAFGQVRLDFAKALDEGNCWRIHFNIGADF
jgi:translocation and assembly module TamA